jgi:hypothetical protein
VRIPLVGSPAGARRVVQHRAVRVRLARTGGTRVGVADRAAVGELDRQSQERVGRQPPGVVEHARQGPVHPPLLRDSAARPEVEGEAEPGRVGADPVTATAVSSVRARIAASGAIPGTTLGHGQGSSPGPTGSLRRGSTAPPPRPPPGRAQRRSRPATRGCHIPAGRTRPPTAPAGVGAAWPDPGPERPTTQTAALAVDPATLGQDRLVGRQLLGDVGIAVHSGDPPPVGELHPEAQQLVGKRVAAQRVCWAAKRWDGPRRLLVPVGGGPPAPGVAAAPARVGRATIMRPPSAEVVP